MRGEGEGGGARRGGQRQDEAARPEPAEEGGPGEAGAAQVGAGGRRRAEVVGVDGVGAGREGAAQSVLDGPLRGGVPGGGVAGTQDRSSRIFSSASRARLARDFTAPRLMPRVAAICASVRSPQ